MKMTKMDLRKVEYYNDMLISLFSQIEYIEGLVNKMTTDDRLNNRELILEIASLSGRAEWFDEERQRQIGEL